MCQVEGVASSPNTAAFFPPEPGFIIFASSENLGFHCPTPLHSIRMAWPSPGEVRVRGRSSTPAGGRRMEASVRSTQMLRPDLEQTALTLSKPHLTHRGSVTDPTSERAPRPLDLRFPGPHGRHSGSKPARFCQCLELSFNFKRNQVTWRGAINWSRPGQRLSLPLRVPVSFLPRRRVAALSVCPPAGPRGVWLRSIAWPMQNLFDFGFRSYF